MPKDSELDHEFSAVMAASRSLQSTRGPVDAIPTSFSGARHVNFAGPPNGSNEVLSSHPNIQAVSSSPTPHKSPITVPVKNYNKIAKGFKVLDARYNELQQKQAATEKELSTLKDIHHTLLTEMEAARRIIHEREMVRQHPEWT